MEMAAKWLDVSKDAIANHNAVRKLFQIIRGRYCATRVNKRKSHSLCVYCLWPIYLEVKIPCRPLEREPPKTPCCDRMIHPGCNPGPMCRRSCHKLLRVLPCVVCKQPIAWGQLCA